MEIQIIPGNRKTLSIQVIGHQVLLRCPKGMPREEALRFLEKHRQWVEKRLLPPQPPLTEAERNALKALAAQRIPERVRHFAPLVGVEYGRISLRFQHSRWGSCSSLGNLNFNCLLLLAPEPVLDYVIVHELCHRLEPNHSKAFWAQVARIIPDYAQQRKWLRQNGNLLVGRL